jgi:hypothetical protein
MTIRASLGARYNFTRQYLLTARESARRAANLERRSATGPLSEHLKSSHLGAVTSAVFHAVAAIESETWAITHHGPGHQFGSNHNDPAPLMLLIRHVQELDAANVLDRTDRILELLGRPAFRRGAQPYQDARLLVRLRNELVHYKSRWDHEMTSDRLQRGLQSMRFPVPRFRRGSSVAFPHLLLGAGAAAWAEATAKAFLDELYKLLGGRRPRWLIITRVRRRASAV